MKISIRKRYLILIIAFLAIIIASLIYLYDLLGGNEEIKIYENTQVERVIAGRRYIGRQTNPEIEKYFTEARELITTNKINGDLVMVQFENDSINNNQIDLFIGISIESEMAEIPSNYEIMEFKSTKKLSIFLSMHPFVRPTPSEVQEFFDSYATENSLILSPYTIEIHYPDNSLAIEAWVD